MHKSVKMDTPCEFINITPLNRLISKCQIKVCYIGEQPNRNRSVITKEVARKMANTLPGNPIVGFYNQNNEDFEEHNRTIEISNGKLKFTDSTRPYGFVDINAKCWFQKYLDDDEIEREYLVTEGYLWTGQYPECNRILEKGNNQSMELDKDTLDATWAKRKNGKQEFFIINEAEVSKLCILGEECEPCFEGANITKFQFSFEDNFKNELFSMMKELKELLNKGGAQVFTTYSVKVGDSLWTALYNHVGESYSIDGVFVEGEQKFAMLKDRNDGKFYRLNFSMDEDNFVPEEQMTEMADYTSAEEPQFALADVEAFENEFKCGGSGSAGAGAGSSGEDSKKKKKKDEEDKFKKSNTSKSDDKSEEPKSGEEKPKDGEEKPEKGKDSKDDESTDKKPPFGEKSSNEGEDDSDEKKKKKNKYNLEEIPEYVELASKYSELESTYNALLGEKATLEAQLAPLTEFKNQAEKKAKEDMIASFYMLSDEDKQDVVTNIDTYSLSDIEAKLSIICVRNKVSFNLDEEDKSNGQPVVFNFNGAQNESTPAWVKAVMDVAEEMK